MNRAGNVMDALAVLVLVVVGIWGAVLYPQLPETIVTHWDASGEADSFSRKSFWSVFGTLMVGAGMVSVFLVMRLVLARRSNLVPSERRTYALIFGYLNLSMAVMFGSIGLASWYGAQLGPWFMVFALLAGVPVLLILGLNMHTMTEERKKLIGPSEPSHDPQYWVLGGAFYSNPDDPRVFVPRPPHTGMGWTTNLATTGGRMFLIGVGLVVVLVFALPFLL
ncbi:MAG: DUF1648 domain-containing protein [Deinococcales bacterium]|nr:DUF1648 domain-containing protein [Deinococcales bacterium]